MPRVLQINVTANWGSTGKIAEGIGQAALSQGWESAIAYGRYANPSASKLIKVGTPFDVYTHYAKNRFFDAEGLGSKRATKQFIYQIVEYNPDIIHLHNIHDHWINYPILFKYLASINTPIVWTFHDCWAFTGHCYHFENAGCFKWRDQCMECPLQQRFSKEKSARNFMLKKELFSSIRNRLTIVPCSEWLGAYVHESFFNGCDISVIHNGVDTHLFTPDLNVHKEKMVLGVSNVWPNYKGLPDFIKLRELLPDDIAIVIVGLTAKQIKSLPRGIQGIQRTSDVHELIDLYRRASVFVNPTKNDTFPTVNLEALSCGTPVVTYQTGGSPEAVDADTGIIVEKGNVHSLAKAIIKALDNPLSPQACRQRALKHFDKDRQFSQYITLYNRLLNL